MARIRSVHPGLWTDERFASVSPLARLLFIGIWNECDDAGSFEWSPLKLKMRVLPADNADAAALLSELADAGCIMAYEIDGRKLGAVRNFATYQRPKKPNSLYPQTPSVRKYTGHKDASVPHHFPTDGEKPPQMEDEGGNKEKEEEEAAVAATEYAFSGRVIKLNDENYRAWEQSYPDLHLPSVLQSRDDWLFDNGKMKNWFIPTSNHLAKLQQAAAAKQREPAWEAPC